MYFLCNFSAMYMTKKIHFFCVYQHASCVKQLCDLVELRKLVIALGDNNEARVNFEDDVNS